jgi:hypothetical protein
MTTDRLLKVCQREFERGIERLFETAPRIPNTGMAEIPVIGGVFIADMPEMIAAILPQVCAALCARERFRRDAPGWPTLPLHEQEIEAMESNNCPRCALTGLYAASLAGEWDYDGHPRFGPFCQGLMAYEHTPVALRTNVELLAQFPPRPLAGLADGKLYWRSPAKLAFDRDMLARIAAFEARAAGH